MSIDWSEFDCSVDVAIADSVLETDRALASRVSSCTRLTDDELCELFPEPSDIKALAELIKVVKSAEAENLKIARIVSNAEKFGGVIVKLLTKLA